MPNAPDLPPPPPLTDLTTQQLTALFVDFDGTLVELAPKPDAIVVGERLAAKLTVLADSLKGRLALVSGRAIADLERHLGPLSLARAGSHGSDCRMASGTVLGAAPAGLPADVLEQVADFAAENGFDVEDKPHGAALHFRSDPALEPQGLAFAQTVAAAHALDVKRGKCVIELVERGANKGSAVAAFMAEPPFAGALPVFLGDDVTDEDGFAKCVQMGGFGILVGEPRQTAAKYRLASVAAVHHWLGL